MRNFEKKVDALEQKAGVEQEKIIIEDLEDGTFRLMSNKKNAYVVLPEKMTPEEWDQSINTKVMTEQDFEDRFRMKAIETSEGSDGILCFSPDRLRWFRYEKGRWLQLLDSASNYWGDPRGL